MKLKKDVPFRPAQYVEHKLLTSILDGTWPPSSALPNERSLADFFGVTRPTLRETLRRLADEGWLTIQHGKPTRVNNYWEKGGMALLGTLSKYNEYLPNGFVAHLLEVRSNLLPGIALSAVRGSVQALLTYLGRAEALEDKAEAFVRYDWELQLLMARHSGNPIYTLMLNDFASLFEKVALRYFNKPMARKTSRGYYMNLYHALKKGEEGVEDIVRHAMEESMRIWMEINPNVA
jgi:GntR family negative regulator for fad regulon and positive regulator of fabA